MISIERITVADGVYLVTPKQYFAHNFEGNEHGTMSGGAQMYMKEYLQQGHFNNKKITPKDLTYLISLEAAHSENVGKNVNYVVINKDGYTFGRNY